MTEISKEYAAAIFELSKEKSAEKDFLDALSLVESELAAEPEYSLLLSSPNIPIRERQHLIEQAFADKIPEYVLSFTELLLENGHMQSFSECVNEYEKMYKALSSVSSAHVVSAIELSNEEKTALIEKLEKLTGNTVAAEYEINESIIGGVIVNIDDKVIDGSIRHRLQEVKEVIGE